MNCAPQLTVHGRIVTREQFRRGLVRFVGTVQTPLRVLSCPLPVVSSNKNRKQRLTLRGVVPRGLF